jgi:hypothetical protein
MFAIIGSFLYCSDAFILAPDATHDNSANFTPLFCLIFGLPSAFVIGFASFGFISWQAINTSHFAIGCSLMLRYNILYALIGSLTGILFGIYYGRNIAQYPAMTWDCALSYCVLGTLIGFLIASIKANQNLRRRLRLSPAQAGQPHAFDKVALDENCHHS